ncbi:hypothetical protein OESDEN_19587 [Oesophagostomum dentatum]|uniref:Uncharacterized protein n=1 Tax=Oesophagostomum dentatum TaxID=61180 RepID=A0A0B1S726_OESDE|nr:hypothetical protein OESDEN_19587 [Oesophagostomum dentatum]
MFMYWLVEKETLEVNRMIFTRIYLLMTRTLKSNLVHRTK